MKLYKYLLIIFFIGLSSTTWALHRSYDSLRMEEINGKSFIIHKVEPKETLFSISRRYKADINDILEANEGLKDGLKMYQELLVPFTKSTSDQTEVLVKKSQKNGKIHIVQQGETMYSISKKYDIPIDSIKKFNDLNDFNISLGDSLFMGSPQKEPISEVQQESDSSRFHIVATSETLYSISLKYKTDIQDLKKWNNLSSNNLNIGQKLLVKKVNSIDTLEIKEVPPPDKPIDTLYVTTDTTRFKTKIEKSGAVDKTIEEGFATKIEGTEDTRKYLALHRNAPMGTVIEVKNQMNNLSIFARVVGKLPETGLNKNVLIRLSHAAHLKLGALDAKIPVEIGYIVE